MKPQDEIIRRRADGSIDTDFYSSAAHSARRVERRLALRRVGAVLHRLVRRFRPA